MANYRIIFLFIFLSSGIVAFGQSKEKAKEDNAFAPAEMEQSTLQKKTMKKKGKKSARGVFNRKMDLKIKEFDKRMQANAKAERKKQREMRKPQYSDPSYFGHKKKPKKRPPGKRKFCKECGIWH